MFKNCDNCHGKGIIFDSIANKRSFCNKCGSLGILADRAHDAFNVYNENNPAPAPVFTFAPAKEKRTYTRKNIGNK